MAEGMRWLQLPLQHSSGASLQQPQLTLVWPDRQSWAVPNSTCQPSMQPTLLRLPPHVVPLLWGSLTLQGFLSAQGASKCLGHPVLWCQLWCPWTSGCLGVLPGWGSEQDMDFPAVCRALVHLQPGWSSLRGPGGCLAPGCTPSEH